MKKFFAFILCIVMLITCLSSFSFALASDSESVDINNLDYASLFEKAFVINGVWKDSDLKSGKSLTFYFRGENITESYNASRHFNDFNEAYSYYLSQSPDIIEDLPVFIFAPGNYDYLITVRFGAIILGANAGITPNSNRDWTISAMANGVPANPARTLETVFTEGLTRTTRDTGNDAKWVFQLEQKESLRGKKADIRFIVDGIKLTGSVGISQYDYSNRLYTDMTLNGQTYQYTPSGERTTLTALLNSTVDNFSGTDANALFSARCNSFNKNDAALKNVRITNLSESAKFLFNKFFRNLTIDGLYFANCESSLFGTSRTGSSFCGNSSAKTAEFDQNIEIKNSVFYKNPVVHTISLGNASAGDGYTKMTANIHNNFFYDSVCFSEQKDYWGIFLVNSAKKGVDYEVSITDNIIHQESTELCSLFHGSTSYQKSKTTIYFNRNKITGKIDTIYPNTNWKSSEYSYINSSLFYDFSYNFHAPSPTNEGTRPVWTYPPTTHLANGYDHKTAPYYLDYDLTELSTVLELKNITGLGSKVQIYGNDIIADCSNMTGVLTPEISTSNGTSIQIFKDAALTSPVTTIDLSKLQKGACYFLKIPKAGNFYTGLLTITTGRYTDITSASQINRNDFELPVMTVNTENNQPLAKNDKENYVNCTVSTDNTKSEYCITDAVAGIRYRGNSTLTAADKKPYRIKFDKKQNLFGMGKAKSWVLLANAFDKTMVRNAIAFAIGEQIGLEYTSKFQFVNLYFNGKYQGVYLLCEQTQTGNNRVDVEEDEKGKLDTGYLVEMAGNGDPDEDRNFILDEVPKNKLADGVKNNWRSEIRAYIKTPELEFCTDAQVDFISDYLNDANYAILTQNWEEFNKLCDVESFAKYFVASTILNNGDAGYQIYMYKREDGGKLSAGPLWDFDQSSAATIQCGDTYDKWYTGSSHPWFDSFINWPEFLSLAKKIYKENYDEIQNILSYYTTEFYPENSYDFHANDIIWNSVEDDYWRITDTIKNLKSYSANFMHLSMWFKNRTAWLNNAYNAIFIPPETISLDKKNLTLSKNEKYTFVLSSQPAYADLSGADWTSSDPTVASIEKGVLTAHKDGSAIITVSVVDPYADEICAFVICRVTVCSDHKYDNACDTNCNVCNKSRTIAHSFSAYVYNYDATCDKDGTKTHSCTVCKYTQTVNEGGTKLINSSKTFRDVPANQWYKKFVDFAVTYGIFSGTAKDVFSPNTNMTRAQFVQVFANISGVDTSNKNVSSGFSDVPRGKWYTAAVTWASRNGIVSGKGGGKFDPEAKVTREEMCVMLVNYIENYLKKPLPATTNVKAFADDKNISGWAKTAVYKCAKAGLVNGVGNNKFDPKASAIRAEGATLFTNFYKKYM